mmetsp:Transcript_33337/g.89245  ORF Transcript_33337/g.89245 Transcript_33337/m.89245 type:complete len:215 (-) Transcript_33337:55-699(-)
MGIAGCPRTPLTMCPRTVREALKALRPSRPCTVACCVISDTGMQIRSRRFSSCTALPRSSPALVLNHSQKSVPRCSQTPGGKFAPRELRTKPRTCFSVDSSQYSSRCKSGATTEGIKLCSTKEKHCATSTALASPARSAAALQPRAPSKSNTKVPVPSPSPSVTFCTCRRMIRANGLRAVAAPSVRLAELVTSFLPSATTSVSNPHGPNELDTS